MKRVAVTGMGCLSALGPDLPAGWRALLAMRSGISVRRVSAADETLAVECPVAAVDRGDIVAPPRLPESRTFQSLDRFCKLAVASAAEAIADARLSAAELADEETAILFGSSTGGLTSLEESYHRIYARRTGRVHPMTVPRFMPSGAASAISLTFGVRGPAWCVSSACASAAHAIAEAAHLVAAGRARIAITGGAEASITYGHLLAWQALGALARDTCRPFSTGRSGMVPGEGAAALVLEDLEYARARGATIHAEIAGSAATSDAHHLTQPVPEGQIRAIRKALAASGLSERDRFLISTHGTGTPLNDACEAAALRAVFAGALADQAVIATKSAHGHLMGATGALELVFTIQALKEGVAPPVLNYLGPDAECDLPLVIGAPRPISGMALLSNSFAFGGLNAVLVLVPWAPRPSRSLVSDRS